MIAATSVFCSQPGPLTSQPGGRALLHNNFLPPREFQRMASDGRLIAHLHAPPELLDLVDDEWRADHLGYG